MTRRIVLVDIGNGLELSGILPSVALHDSYSARVTARNGVPPYTYSTDSTLPTGFDLDPMTGIISASDAGEAGSFVIAVMATDLSGASITRVFSLTVTSDPIPLTLTGSYAAATVGAPYSSDLTITGGGGTYSNPRVTVGMLPAWATLSVMGDKLRLSGTPSGSATTVNITVAVDSGDGQMATSAQVIAVVGGQRYWRLNITATNGDTICAIQEIELRATPGGPTLTTPLSPTSASSVNGGSGVYSSKNVVDGDKTSSTVGLWLSETGLPQWIYIDLGPSAPAVVEVGIWPENYPPFDATRSPRDFVIQSSADASTWNDRRTLVGETGWSTGHPRSYSIP